jgi:hypothetical protein
MLMTAPTSRRRFLLASAAALLAPAAHASRAWGAQGGHPTPRPGITAAKLPTREQLAHHPDAIPIFEQVREIPGVVDGIRCKCGCAGNEAFHSLLSCYEGPDPMAMHCEVCQAQGTLAYRLHQAGKTLDEIRREVDARFR